MSKYQDGEHIFLNFEDYDNEEFFRGWLNEDECKSAIISSYGDDCEVVRVKRHTYAFWGIGTDCMGEKGHFLYERKDGGRGRFKVTVVESKRCY